MNRFVWLLMLTILATMRFGAAELPLACEFADLYGARFERQIYAATGAKGEPELSCLGSSDQFYSMSLDEE